MKPKQDELLQVQPQLPWKENDDPAERFKKLVKAIRDAGETESESVDLDALCDRYLQTLWTLSLSAPLKYIDGHPFDLAGGGEFVFFGLENKQRGQAKALKLKKGQTLRKTLKLKAPDGVPREAAPSMFL